MSQFVPRLAKILNFEIQSDLNDLNNMSLLLKNYSFKTADLQMQRDQYVNTMFYWYITIIQIIQLYFYYIFFFISYNFYIIQYIINYIIIIIIISSSSSSSSSSKIMLQTADLQIQRDQEIKIILFWYITVIQIIWLYLYYIFCFIYVFYILLWN